MAEKTMTETKTATEPYQDEEQGSLHVGEYMSPSLGHGELEVIAMRERIPILRKLRAAEAWLDKKLGIETTGADRVPEGERRPPSIFNVSESRMTSINVLTRCGPDDLLLVFHADLAWYHNIGLVRAHLRTVRQ